MSIVSYIIGTAADNLERDGWQQDYLGQSGGPQCMIGAMYTVAFADELSGYIDYTNAKKAMKNYLGVRYLSLYNDTPGRTKEEIIKVMKMCATAYENSHTFEDVS